MKKSSLNTAFVTKLLTAFILFISIHASAKAFSQVITASGKNLSVQQVFKIIKRQTGYQVIYNPDLIKNISNKDVDIKNGSINDLLDLFFKETQIGYEIKYNTIVIKPIQKLQNAPDAPAAITPPVTGIVQDENGKPLANVSVKIKGTSKGTITNNKGEFTIETGDNDILVFSFVGYEPKEIGASSVNNTTVALQPSNKHLNDVVVTALGIKRTQRDLSYNVQTIQGSDVTKTNDANFASALAGKVAGATVNASASGVGGSVRLVLRGTKSITGNNNALYVVDGIPMPNLFTAQPGGIFNGSDNGEGIANFNPDDIENVSVLSGASAAALYGYEAANGVVLITTKKGVANKTGVNFSSGVTFASPFILPDFQNTYGPSPTSNGVPAITSWGTKLSSSSSYKAGDFFQTGNNFTNSINVSTGSERSQTYFSAASVNSTGIIHNNNYKRYNFTIHNTSTLIPDKLDLDVSAMYLFEKRQNQPGQGEYNNPLIGAYLFPAGDVDSANYVLKNYQVYNPSRNFYTQNWAFGDLGLEAQNPYWIINKEFFNTNRSRFLGNVALKYSFNKYLNLTGRVKYDEANDNSQSKLYASTISFFTGGDNGSFSYGTANNKQTYADLILNYAQNFNDFGLKVIVGSSILDNKNSAVNAGGPLNLVPNFFSISNIAQDRIGASSTLPQRQQNQAVFGSVDLGYKNLLFLNVTGRNDWNSALAYTSSSSIFYPSVGLSGVISDMIKLPQFISYAKLRTSYSEVGNPPAQYLSNPLPGITNGTVSVVTAAPFNIKPERTKSIEGGADFRFMKNHLSFSVTYYNTNTLNQIFSVAIPAGASIYSSYYINAGKINNRGLEMSLGYNSNFGKFQWNPAVTFSLNRNKVVQLLHNAPNPFTGGVSNQDTLYPSASSTYAQWLTVGGSAGDIYTTGLQRNKDGSLLTTTITDPASPFFNATVPVTSDTMRKVGNSNPRYNFGFSNSFSYKGFNLSFLITARLGGQVVSETQSFLDFYGASKTTAQARDAGSVQVGNTTFSNVQAYYQTINQPGGGGLSNIALSQYVYSASNVRLGELTFGYTIPGLFKNTIKSLGINFIARNLWMIYNKAPFDPELAASTGTFYQGFDFFNQPSQKYLGIKLNITF